MGLFRMIPGQTLRNATHRMANAVKDAFFPTRCLACKNFFHTGQHKNNAFKSASFGLKRLIPLSGLIEKTPSLAAQSAIGPDFTREIFEILMSPYLCPGCLTGFIPIESPKCSKCGLMFKSRQGEDHVCGECLDSPKKFGIARSLGVYEQILMKAIHCMKYNGKIQLARPFAMLLFTVFLGIWDKNSIDLIVPVPLHKKKLRARGFNSTFLLIRDWERISEKLNFESPAIPFDKDVLIRRRWTKSQTALDRKTRLINIKNAFGIKGSAKIKDKRILLVDDVYTTGATANECSRTLLNAGAGHVDVLTLARAM